MENKHCHSPGCQRSAVKVLLDGKGRKSYRCDAHSKPKMPAVKDHLTAQQKTKLHRAASFGD